MFHISQSATNETDEGKECKTTDLVACRIIEKQGNSIEDTIDSMKYI